MTRIKNKNEDLKENSVLKCCAKDELKKLLDYERSKSQTITLAVFNRKGGVGKSTVSTCLSHVLSSNGFNILLIDADPQQSSTNILNVNKSIKDMPAITSKNFSSIAKECRKRNEQEYIVDDLFGNAVGIENAESDYKGLHELIMSVIEGFPITEAQLNQQIIKPTYEKAAIEKTSEGNKLIIKSDYFGFDLLPSSEEVTDDELLLISEAGKSTFDIHVTEVLKRIVDQIKSIRKYDVIIIDCPPSLGVMALNAVTASDGSVLIGLPDDQSVFSLGKTKKNFRDIKSLDSKQKGIIGFVINAIEPKQLLKPIVENRVKRDLNIKVFNTTIPKSANAPKATSQGVLYSMLDHNAFNKFEELAVEILQGYYDNEAWEEYRRNEYSNVRDKLISDEVFMNDVKKKAYDKMELELKERAIDINSLSQDKINIIINRNMNRYIENYIKEEYDKGNLWKPRTSEYHVDIFNNENDKEENVNE